MAFTHLWKRLIRIAQLRPPVNSGRIPQNVPNQRRQNT